jgi:hypothetical protein
LDFKFVSRAVERDFSSTLTLFGGIEAPIHGLPFTGFRLLVVIGSANAVL